MTKPRTYQHFGIDERESDWEPGQWAPYDHAPTLKAARQKWRSLVCRYPDKEFRISRVLTLVEVLE